MAKKIELDLETVKKYAFWVVIPIGVLFAVFAGWHAVGSIAQDLETQKNSLQSQRSAVERLRNEAPRHPNQATIDAINTKRNELVENVYKAWTTMVETQRQQNRWTGLSAASTRDIESKNFLDNLDGPTLENYLNFAQAEINRMLDKNFARPNEPELYLRRVQQYRRLPNGTLEPLERLSLAESRGSSGLRGSGGGVRGDMPTSPSRGAPDGSATITQGTVVWHSPSLDITMQNWQQRPHSFEVWLTQEDIWVYQTLLWVIAESNRNVRNQTRILGQGGPTGSGPGSGIAGVPGAAAQPLSLRESVVKEILEISIGRNAAEELHRQSSRKISMGTGGFGSEFDSFGGGSFGGSSFGGGSFGSSDSFSSSDGFSGAPTAEALRNAALAFRYVDVAGQPESMPDLTAPIRRMPIFMRLVVDQMHISDVLVNCANSPMPIDVLWITINPDATQPFEYAASTGTASGGFGDGASFGAGGRSGGRAGAGGRATSSSRGRDTGASGGGLGRAGTSDIDFGPNAVTIEIFGSINIFSHPVREAIGAVIP